MSCPPPNPAAYQPTPIERRLAKIEVELGHLRRSIERLVEALSGVSVEGTLEETEESVPSLAEQLDARRAERARRNG